MANCLRYISSSGALSTRRAKTNEAQCGLTTHPSGRLRRRLIPALGRMKGTHILSLIAASLWALLILTGIQGVNAVLSQQVPGWPSPGQIHYYVYIPAIMFALIVSGWALIIRWRRLKVFTVTFIVLALLVLPVYLLAYTGGV